MHVVSKIKVIQGVPKVTGSYLRVVVCVFVMYPKYLTKEVNLLFAMSSVLNVSQKCSAKYSRPKMLQFLEHPVFLVNGEVA